MKLILQAIKSLINKIELLVINEVAKLRQDVASSVATKVNVENPVMTGSLRLNPLEGKTIGEHSTAEGFGCTASASCAHAEGFGCTASDGSAHAEGFGCTASGYCSHAENYKSTASGNYSHAEGYECVSAGLYSHAEGAGTVAFGAYQHVQGKNNIQDNAKEYAHIVGNGTEGAPSNAHTLDWDGNAWFAGTVEGTALILKSSTAGSSKRLRITVDDGGTLSAAEVSI